VSGKNCHTQCSWLQLFKTRTRHVREVFRWYSPFTPHHVEWINSNMMILWLQLNYCAGDRGENLGSKINEEKKIRLRKGRS
jgi:hypothetical protein